MVHESEILKTLKQEIESETGIPVEDINQNLLLVDDLDLDDSILEVVVCATLTSLFQGEDIDDLVDTNRLINCEYLYEVVDLIVDGIED
jgi:hypothetical protein